MTACRPTSTRYANALTGHQIQLMKDIAMFDKMYEANLDYYRELSMYIEAGRLKLRQTAANEVLPELQRRASQTGLMEDAQAANDLANMCGRFEKKLFDLDLTRNISIQMAPQIRLLQNNDQQMAEKIQSRWPTRYRCGRTRWCCRWGWSIPARRWRPSAP